MAIKVAFSEAPQDLCIIDVGVPWHISSSLHTLHCSCCDSQAQVGQSHAIVLECTLHLWLHDLVEFNTIISLTIPICIPKMVQHFVILLCE
jgi:hypothetical protein